MEKFTLTNLKKQLDKKTKKELIQEISTLCQKFSQVQEYYKTHMGHETEILKKYKAIIKKEFIESKTRGLPNARLEVAEKAVNDFKKLTNNLELIAEIMFTFVESISRFSTEFAPDTEEYYTEPEEMFEDVLVLLKESNLLDKFEIRAYEIVDNATEGWGHRDSLKERYEEVYGKFIK
jgi:hypothetical protein